MVEESDYYKMRGDEKMKRTIVLASNNQHKLKEFQRILTDYTIIALHDIEFDREIEETGETFEENALIKAMEHLEFIVQDMQEVMEMIRKIGKNCKKN